MEALRELVTEMLDCNICHELIQGAAACCTASGHLYCSKCHNETRKCPTPFICALCRSPLKPDFATLQFSVKLRGSCCYRSRGCSFKESIEEVLMHESYNCLYRLPMQEQNIGERLIMDGETVAEVFRHLSCRRCRTLLMADARTCCKCNSRFCGNCADARNFVHEHQLMQNTMISIAARKYANIIN